MRTTPLTWWLPWTSTTATTTALMAAGMPESIAASRAALVFGMPMVDGQYLEVAKQPVMPTDILVASADEALARAFCVPGPR